MRPLLLALLLAGCARDYTVSDYVLALEDGGLTITRTDGKVLVSDVHFSTGEGDEIIDMQMGSYLVESGASTYAGLELQKGYGHDPIWSFALDAGGDTVGEVQVSLYTTGVLAFQVLGSGERLRWDAACTGDDHFAGLGQMQQDVDHVGEAFPLWVSEPGIGKTQDDVPPDDWFLTGTRHSTSYPDPFLLRPEPVGLLLETAARVDVDLCTGDRWTLDAWAPGANFYLVDGDSTLDIVSTHTLLTGYPEAPPDWAIGPWNDAVGGVERVREVAAELRAAGAASSVIWTEDWKGGEESTFGYRLKNNWTVDTKLYPDAAGIDAELEAQGFKWFAYFSPFVTTDADVYAEAAEFLTKDANGAPYLFPGVTFGDTGVLDLTDPDARAWAAGKIQAAMALGFDGWMADYGEWLPTDTVLAAGDPMADHNAYPLWWQDTNQLALDGVEGGDDVLFFTRSGWETTPARTRAAWGGDQRTSFDADDGLPTVVPLGIGAGISGIGWFGTDIAGYQSVGNAPSTKELWFRWCELGAFSPLMRTHHGAFLDDNWQFDSDAETLAHYARYANIHAALFPYLAGLGRAYTLTGAPLLQAPFLRYPDEPWSRTDAWLLGPSLFVSPVLAEGATTVSVDLPAGTTWYDFWTGAVRTSGTVEAPLDTIPVFAPAGAIIPMFTTPPDSLVAGPVAGIRTLAEADTERTIYVYAGARGSFTEADLTEYSTDGVATGSGTTTVTMEAGTIEAGGLTLTVTGDRERTYTLVVSAP